MVWEENRSNATAMSLVKIEGLRSADPCRASSERAGSLLRDVNGHITRQAVREHQIHITHHKHETLIRKAGRRQW
jgi:hypothetical protein